MHDVTIHRLSCCAPGPILIPVEKEKTTMTTGQLYALELAARRARSEELARLLFAGGRSLKAGVARALDALKWKGVRHA